jgi:hypothetical protein
MAWESESGWVLESVSEKADSQVAPAVVSAGLGPVALVGSVGKAADFPEPDSLLEFHQVDVSDEPWVCPPSMQLRMTDFSRYYCLPAGSNQRKWGQVEITHKQASRVE